MIPEDALDKKDRNDIINGMFQDWCDADLNTTKSTYYEDENGKMPFVREYKCTGCGRIIKITSLDSKG